MIRPVLAGLIAALLGLPATATAAPASAAGPHATVREYKTTIRTYPFGNPNPLPVFGRIYPYFRFDQYTDRPVDREWTVVELENAYLRVRVIPEIGGKVWSAIEKSTGRAFIYDNHVVKFRDIAMRGPWTSGGLEPNYGIIGHTPNCATPVDYVTGVRADGAATVTVGTLDLLTRTAWRLEIALPPDAAYFTTRSFWQNTSGIEQPYYTWMNTGLKAAGNLEFVYPGTKYLGHAGEVSTWPVHPENGKNLAFYNQNDFGSYKWYHVFGEYSDFWGASFHDDAFGMARYSLRDDKLGKKIWIWGLSRQGMIWETLLTDTDGQYVEVQSGRLFNQAAEASTFTPFKHRGFLPYATDTWTEYWMPVVGTGGMVKANDLGALNVRAQADGLVLAFSPVVRIDTDVDVFDGDTLVRRIPVSFRPMRPWTVTLHGAIPQERLRIRIAGNRFEYVADRTRSALSRPVKAPREFDWTSTYGTWLKGKELLRQREYADAEAAIDQALGKDSAFLPALADKALLRSRAGDDQAAFAAAARGLAIDTYDPQSNYYYGVSAMRLGRAADARDGFDVAAQDPGYRAAALVQLARLSIRARQLEAAESYARRSLEADHAGTEARLLLAVAMRLGGRTAEARSVLRDLDARDPLNHGAHFETWRLQASPSAPQAFVRGIRNELPQETYLELATWYCGLSMDGDARAVLALAPPVAEVLYWRAWLERTASSAAERGLARAAEASPSLVFPFRPESVPVFTWAMAQPGAGWKPAYYLALVERGLGDAGRAAELVAPLGNTPDFAPFYVFRAELATSSDPARARTDLERAAELDPKDWRIGRLLVDRALADGRIPDAEAVAARYDAADPSNYIAGMLHARTLLLGRKYAEALARLERLQVLPYEGATEGRALFREAHLMLAVEALSATRYDEAERHVTAAREWPEHLGAGAPYPADADERLEDFLLAASLTDRGAKADARKALEHVTGSTAPRTTMGTAITALALRQLGRQSEADALLAAPGIANNEAVAAWARQLLRGERVAPPAAERSSKEAGEEARVFAAFITGTHE